MELFNLLLAGGGTLLGGAISFVLFFPYKKRAEQLKNESSSNAEWQKICNELGEQNKTLKTDSREKDAKIDSLYSEINRHRDQKAELQKENTSLAVENTRLRILKCEVAGCTKRTPPTGY